jgi:hypothetical protein
MPGCWDELSAACCAPRDSGQRSVQRLDGIHQKRCSSTDVHGWDLKMCSVCVASCRFPADCKNTSLSLPVPAAAVELEQHFYASSSQNDMSFCLRMEVLSVWFPLSIWHGVLFAGRKVVGSVVARQCHHILAENLSQGVS